MQRPGKLCRHPAVSLGTSAPASAVAMAFAGSEASEFPEIYGAREEIWSALRKELLSKWLLIVAVRLILNANISMIVAELWSLLLISPVNIHFISFYLKIHGEMSNSWVAAIAIGPIGHT